MIYRLGERGLDLAHGEVRHRGQRVPIEPQVCDVLGFLVANRDRLITRDELVQAVWHGRIVSDAAISSRLRDARRAIGDDGSAQRWIRTVHGRGFRFVGDVRAVAPVAAIARARGEAQPLAQDIRYCRTADAVRIAFASTGSGSPIVKAANWMSHLEYDLESPIWRHWIEAFSRPHRLIRYDGRGNGLSDREVPEISFVAMVAGLEAVIEAAGVDRFVLFGISQGCAVSVAYAVRHPERVTHLVLSGFAQGWRTGAALRDEAEMRRRTVMGALIEVGWGQDNPAFRQMFASRFMPGASREQMAWFNELQRKTVSPEVAAKLDDVFGSIDVEPLSASVQAPAPMLHARADGDIPLARGRAFATGMLGARFVTVESPNPILLAGEPAFARFVDEVARFAVGGTAPVPT